MQALIRSKSAGITGGRGTAGAGPGRNLLYGSSFMVTTCLSIPNGPGSLLEKRVFHPFLTHFWFQNSPFSRHFAIFCGPKRATTGSKRPKNTCLSIPSGLGTTLEKMIFFAPGTLVDPPLAPHRARAGLPSGSTK